MSPTGIRTGNQTSATTNDHPNYNLSNVTDVAMTKI